MGLEGEVELQTQRAGGVLKEQLIITRRNPSKVYLSFSFALVGGWVGQCVGISYPDYFVFISSCLLLCAARNRSSLLAWVTRSEIYSRGMHYFLLADPSHLDCFALFFKGK